MRFFMKKICFLPFKESFWRYASNIKYSYSFTPGSIKFVPYTLGQIVDQAAEDAGDVTAFVSPTQHLRKTFTEFKEEVDKLASGFLSLGLVKGDRVALCAPNIYEWPVTYFAAAKAGLISVNINPANQADELEYCLNKVNCKALVVSETFRTQDFYKILCSFIPELPSSIPGQLSSSNVESLKHVILIKNQAETPKSGTTAFEDVLNRGNAESNKLLSSTEGQIQFDDAANIQFTSGTTGNPKGAVLSHHSLINNALFIGKLLGYDMKKPTVCCLVPFYHSFACGVGLIGTVFYKNTLVMPFPGFSGEDSIKAIETEKCTSVYGAPTMFIDILQRHKAGKYDISSMRQVVTGGAPCPQEIMVELKKGLNIEDLHNGYGTTETSPAIASIGTNIPLEEILSGFLRPLQNVEVKIADKDGNILPVNTQGEICIRGHNVFMGYWKDGGSIDPAVDAGRWYHTGDLGEINEKGYVKINGRVKDMVIRGGENLYPVEIENFLHKHPSILEAHVCGVPDPKMGEELCAWVKLKEGEKVTDEDIKEFCKGKISHFKIPRYIMFVEDFPKVPSGKVQKFVMAKVSKEKLGL